MKKLLFFLLLLISINSEAQSTIKYKIDYEAFRTSDKFTEKWGNWTEWNKINGKIQLTVDSFDQTITIHSVPKETYEIVEEIDRMEGNGKIIIIFSGIDSQNTKCKIEFVHYETKGDQIYIRWTNFQLVYQITKI